MLTSRAERVLESQVLCQTTLEPSSMMLAPLLLVPHHDDIAAPSGPSPK